MASNPSMMVRVAANIAELRANLLEGRSQIETTTAAMAKLATSLTGEKLIQNAHNITAAVNSIGGASKLTEAEQARVNVTLEKALEKYRALGKEAPQAMIALAEATKQVETPTGGVSTKMIALGSAIGTMAANALAALGRLALDGLKALATGISELVMNSGKVAGIDQSFRTLAAGINESGNAMLGAMRTGTRGLVTDLDLMTAANKAMLLGLPVTSKEMGMLSQTAVTLGRAMGQDATKSIDDLITALGRSSPMILDNLGLSVKVGEANEVYAAKLGTTAEKLTDAEKKTAFYNAAMAAAATKVASLGESHLTLGDNIAKAGVWWTNFKNDLSIAIARSPALTAAMETLGTAFTAAFGGTSSTRVQTMIGYINTFAIAIVDGGLVLVEWGRTGAQVFGALQVPIKTVTVVVATLIERFAAGIATLADLASRLPGVGSAFDGVAAATKKAADFWASARTEAGSSLKASLDLATGQGVVHGALDKVETVLTTMKAKMVEASHTTVTHTEKTTEQLAALRAAATAHAGNEAAIVKSDTALRALNADLEKGVKVLPAGIALFANMDTKLTPLAVSMKGLGGNTAAANALFANMEDTLTPLAVSLAGLKGGLHFAAETIADEVAPALVKAEEAARKTIATFSEAMDLVRAGQGTMTGTLPGNTDSSPAHRVETQRAWDEHRYWGPVMNGSPSNPRGTGPDWAAIGFRAMGGPVAAGNPYVVGERGPELFVPDRAGNITANGGAGGMVVHVGGVHVHGNFFGNEERLASETSSALINRLKNLGVRLPVQA